MISTGEWGEFFSTEISPFKYNESIAIEYYPIEQVQAQVQGYKWRELESKEYNFNALTPQSTEEYKDINNQKELLDGIVKCEVTGKPFKITKPELEFYIKHNLTIPTKHPDQRQKERNHLRAPRIFNHSK